MAAFDPSSSARLRDSLAVAVRQSRRLGVLVGRLLDVSVLAAGRFKLNREELDLCELVRGAVEELRDRLRQSGSTLTIDASPSVIGWWDRVRLAQVLTNLLDNAVKFGLGNPIKIRIEATASRAKLVVQDHGIGLSAEAKSRLFGKFERAVSHRHYGGLGLGLYLSRQIVEAHGGTISVESIPNAGTTFVVELPRSAVGASS
jgi:signal transduction histidine kinase